MAGVTPRAPASDTAPRRASRAVAALLAAALVAGLVGSCGGDDAPSGPCGPVRREPLDRRAVHVLPGADDPDYQTDPPTSGPHIASPTPGPVIDRALAPAEQVGLLEEGLVLVQHTGLSAADQEAVEGLAGDGVVVAPADALPEGAAVIATAWVTKQVCTAVDLTALRRFAADHGDEGPGAHG